MSKGVILISEVRNLKFVVDPINSSGSNNIYNEIPLFLTRLALHINLLSTKVLKYFSCPKEVSVA